MKLGDAIRALGVIDDALMSARETIPRLEKRAEDAERELAKAAKRIVDLEQRLDSLCERCQERCPHRNTSDPEFA